MELRTLARTEIPARAGKEGDTFYVELDIPETVRAAVIDISLKGIGIEIRDLDRTKADYLRNVSELFLKIHAGNTFFIAGVRNVWNNVTAQGKGFTYKGGMIISIISPQDNIQLASIINMMRNEGSC
ncbi:MAG: hypothetical protein CVV44_12305 [Spirochaetae bacterium HGW-Spirochaetae-1]|jgi:hypothetical protein|nr:MAG: hypothetical protein CVV44_12305 [Spirochaetae bacterium HGW-Spirochaetae-1]